MKTSRKADRTQSIIFFISITISLPLHTQTDTINPIYEELIGDDATQKSTWIEISASNSNERSLLAEAGMSLDEINENSVCGIIPNYLIHNIKDSGFVIKSQTPLNRLIEEDLTKTKRFPFLSYNHVESTLKMLAKKHHDVASLTSMGRSIQSRNLSTLRINTTEKNNESSIKTGILFIGTMHAREHLATTVALELALWLCNNKKNLHDFLSKYDIYITPLFNPDGSEFDLDGKPYRYFRKNMRINHDKRIGVDLNRNFSYGWGERGSSNFTGSETYRGPFPFSEPESRALKNFLENKTNIKAFVSYHSYGELILYPWGNTQKPIENIHDRKLHESIAQGMATITGYAPQQASRLYIASGDTTDWAYATHKLISFTIELFPKQYGRINGSGFYPTEKSLIKKTATNNIKAALYLMEKINLNCQ